MPEGGGAPGRAGTVDPVNPNRTLLDRECLHGTVAAKLEVRGGLVKSVSWSKNALMTLSKIRGPLLISQVIDG